MLAPAEELRAHKGKGGAEAAMPGEGDVSSTEIETQEPSATAVAQQPLPPIVTSALLSDVPRLRHGFYGRRGGVSTGAFASLNCGEFCGDSPSAVRQNRARVAANMAVGVGRQSESAIFVNRQTHSNRVRIIQAESDPSQQFAGDGLVTAQGGFALGVLTADCVPVLFADVGAGVVGAAHAGWRGALAGVTDAVVAAMVRLGAERGRIRCALGPCIQQGSYRVGEELRGRFLAESPVGCEGCFVERGGGGGGSGRAETETDAGEAVYFDLPEYVRLRLVDAGVDAAAISVSDVDTCADARRFFSHRRSCLQGEGQCGRQVSVIGLV